MDSTTPESSTAANGQSSEQSSSTLQSTPNTPDRVHIEPPAKGEVRVVDIQNADEIAFNFDLKNVRISAIDVDLVILFADNSKLILPGLAMSLLGAKAPKLRSLNELLNSQEIVAAISQVNLAETIPSIHLASSDFLPKKQGGNAADDKASADGSQNAEQSPTASEVVVTPVRPNVIIDVNKSNSASGARVEAVEAGSIAGSKLNLANAGGEPPAPKNPPSSSISQGSSAAQGNAPFSMNAADVTIKALALAESSETPQSDGKILVGGAGAAAAAEDASFAAQSARESLSGSAGNDIIYADDPRFSNSGSAARLLDVSVTMPTSNISATQAIISGLPAGYSILNASFINGNWVMPVGQTKPNNFQIQLVYKIPDDSIQPDANGFYSRFNMSMTFSGTNGAGGNGTISATTVIGVRDVNAAEDQNFIDPSSGKPVVILYRRPAGNIIDSGEGNDTVYAAAGADSISGGDGSNLIHYGNSQSAVSVNLSAGLGSGGFAEGDQFANIQSVIGSNFSDTIIGNDADNTLAGKAGADSLSGGDGNDVADYSGSSLAVTVNLATGEGIGGDAQGDKLSGIEAAIGSSNNDVFVAGQSGSTLRGEQGNDTFVSGVGADSFDGGTGDNLVDYRNSSTSISVDLKANTAFGGDAEGDHYAFVEHINGSSHADTIVGDDSDNLLDGNIGDDSLSGGLGNDTLRAGGGNDVLFGEAGNDLLIASTGSSTLIGGDGNDTFNGTDGKATVDYQYASSGILITLNETNSATSSVSGTDRDVLISINDIRGSRFGDSISGNSLNNFLFGGEGADALAGGTGADTLEGGKDNDTLNGGTGDDLLLGGDDQDLLAGGTGNDTIDGGSGINTISFDYATSGHIATITLANTGPSTATLGELDRDEFINIQNVIGSQYSDSITGNDADNVINANLGDDTIDGGIGNDTLIGGGDNDAVSYATTTLGVNVNLITGVANGNESGLDQLQSISGVIGGSGNDTVTGNDAYNAITTGIGDNLVYGSVGFDTIIGDTGTDTVDYSSLNTAISADLSAKYVQKNGSQIEVDLLQNIENIIGSSVADFIGGDTAQNNLSGGTGNDTILGLTGHDTLRGGSGADSLDGGSDNDLLISGIEGDFLDGADTSVGGQGDDTVYSGQGADSIRADIGNDLVYAESGADIVDLGDGHDTADGGTGADTISGGSGNDSLIGAEGSDTLDGGDDHDTLIGGSDNDSLIGGLGNDTLNGGIDNDTLMGGFGNDTLDGGANNDTVDYSYVLSSGTTNGLNGITVTLNGGTSVNVTGLATGDQDTIRNFEHVIGTSFNDSIVGDSNTNSLAGGAGHDTLAGFGSADTLDGGAGDDCIIGTGGSDIMRGGQDHDHMLIDQSFLGGGGSIDGGSGMDTVTFAANSGNLTLTTANFDNIVTNVEVLDFTSVGTNVTMSLNATDIASLTGQGLGVNNKLDIFQNSGDQISVATQAGFSFDTTTSNGVTTYTFYNSNDPHDPANQLAQINVHGS